jgi:hypothetical protein
MPTYQSNISLIGGLPSTWAAAAWIHPCTGARLALTPHWASAAACRRGTRPPQVLKTQGAKGCSRRTGPISQRRYSTADRLAREGYRESELRIRKEADGDMVHRRICRKVRPRSLLKTAEDNLLQAVFGVNFCVRTLLNQPWRYLDLDCRGPLGSAPAAPDHGALVPMLLKRRMWLWA